MPEPEETAAVIELAIGGDQPALERLLLDHYSAISRHLSSRIPQPLETIVGVEDIVQQTYTKVFQNISRFEQRDDASFLSWLITIGENCLRDAVRTQLRQKRGGNCARWQDRPLDDASGAARVLDAIADSVGTASQAMARREAIQAIQVAVAGLPADYQEAVALRYFQGRSLEETAVLMQRTPGAVRGLLDRARKKLCASLERASRYLSSK